MKWRALAAALILVGLVAASTAPQAAQRGQPATRQAPRLLVVLVVDQFRADYVDWYGHQWTAGLRRLVNEGAYFTRASLPHGVSKTCVGHAAIGTGTRPATHGLIDNEWYDRGRRAVTPCTFDPSVNPITLGHEPAAERHGPALLTAPTLAETLRAQLPTPPRIVSMSLKARSAIGLSGRGGPSTIVMWKEDQGAWATSTAYATKAWAEIADFVRQHPITATRGQVWQPFQLPARYVSEDDGPGEASPATFPHPLTAPSDAAFSPVWNTSPFADAYLGGLASAMISRLSLGRRATTDYLAVGFSALDLVGHAYGPRSHEVQDVLIRLDDTIGQLLDTLDASVGRSRYVVALSTDHGVALLPEQALANTGAAGGRFAIATLEQAIESALGRWPWRARSIESTTGAYVYFRSGVLDAIRADVHTQRAVTRAAEAVPGIARVYWPWELESTAATTDPLLQQMRHSYVKGRSGDLAFVVEPHWTSANSGAQHGSPHAYDTAVPIMLFGHGVSPGRYSQPATLIDIAPTLAALAGVRLPRAEGRVLTEALTR